MSGFLLGLVPDWLKFVFAHWEWLLAAFLSGVVVGALLGFKRLLVVLLVVLTFGLALRWLRPASEPAWETGEPHRVPRKQGDRRYDPDINRWVDK